MTIKVGDRLPAGTLQEFHDVEKDGCSIGPNPVTIDSLTRGKKVVIFGLPGAFTPTCSAKHVPSYINAYDKLKAKGVDEIACLSVNDPFVMGAWGREQNAVLDNAQFTVLLTDKQTAIRRERHRCRIIQPGGVGSGGEARGDNDLRGGSTG